MSMKFSLVAQIEAVDLQIAACRRDKKNSVNAYQITRLEAARATLVWLQANENLIKQRLAS
jgi:hypothetical protein